MDIERLTPTTRRRIADLLADPLFELIPLPSALDQAAYLTAGARVSVTASPTRTLEQGLDLCADLINRGFRVTPHLSARMTSDMAHLERLMGKMAALGMTTAFVVGGDGDYQGEFFDGLSLLEAMDKIGHDLALGVPAYPEGHPDISDGALAQALHDKEGHASWMTTQMCFDGGALRDWLERTRADEVRLPVVLGLPGPTDRLQLLKVSARIGVGRSLSFLRKNTGLMSTFVKPGGYEPGELLEGLGDYLADDDADIQGLHIYTFNQCDRTEDWRRRILAAL